VAVAVLEVARGRLDATNVVEPIASAITAIDFDHEDYLGDSLDAIAREKAGVMRSGRVTVLGGALAPEAHAALLDEARRRGARIVEATQETELPLALSGGHMRRNAAVACGLIEAMGAAEPSLRVDRAAVMRGLREVRWPGRLAVVHEDPRVVIDGATTSRARASVALPALVGARPWWLLFPRCATSTGARSRRSGTTRERGGRDRGRRQAAASAARSRRRVRVARVAAHHRRSGARASRGCSRRIVRRRSWSLVRSFSPE
jgi:hypothetical protein